MPSYDVTIVRARKIHEKTTIRIMAQDEEEAKDIIMNQDDPDNEEWETQDESIEDWRILRVKEVR